MIRFILPLLCSMHLSVGAQNLLNSDFELIRNDFPEYWTTKKGDVTLDSTQAYSGKYCMKFVDTSWFIESDFRSTFFEIEGDSTYILTAMVKHFKSASGSDEGRFFPGIYYFDEDTTFIMGGGKGDGLAFDKWALVTTKSKAPSHAKFAFCRISTTANGNATGLIDSISIYKTETVETSKIVAKTLEIQLFPNPATSSFSLSGDLYLNNQVNIKVYNAFGSLVKEFTVNEQNMYVISELVAGIYTIEIGLKQEVCRVKMLKR
jgi:hypothetical protein